MPTRMDADALYEAITSGEMPRLPCSPLPLSGNGLWQWWSLELSQVMGGTSKLSKSWMIMTWYWKPTVAWVFTNEQKSYLGAVQLQTDISKRTKDWPKIRGASTDTSVLRSVQTPLHNTAMSIHELKIKLSWDELMGPSDFSWSIIKHQQPSIFNHFDQDSLQPAPWSLSNLFRVSPGLASMAREGSSTCLQWKAYRFDMFGLLQCLLVGGFLFFEP